MSSRLHSVDAARAILLLLGLPYHMAGVGVYDMEAPRLEFANSPTILIFMSVIHAFRMFAFFILSGYFSAMIVEKRGKNSWIIDRMSRLGIPLLAGMVTIGVAQHWLKATLLDSPPAFTFGLPITLGPLWFLCVLILYCLTYLAIPEKLTAKAGKALADVGSSRWALVALMALLSLWGFFEAGLRTKLGHSSLSYQSLEISLNWVQFLPAYAMGVMAWSSGLRERLFHLLGWKLAISTLLLAVIYVLLDTLVRPSIGLPFEKSLLEKLASNAIAPPLALLASVFVFGLLSRLIKREFAIINFVVDGAMAIYLVHLPFTEALAWGLQFAHFPPVLSWILGTIGTLAISIVLFLLLRANPVTAVAFCGKPIRALASRKTSPTMKQTGMSEVESGA